MAIVGYARTSTREQNIAAQVAELEAAGAVRVFSDEGVSSRRAARPGWQDCLNYLRDGEDTLLVRRLDRLAGSTTGALQTMAELDARGIGLKSLTEPDIDTTTPMGKALAGFVAILLQLRVDTIRENTRLGLDHARAQGRVGGRPTVMTPDKIAAAVQLRNSGQSITAIARALDVGASTVTRALAR